MTCTCEVIDATELGSHVRKTLRIPDSGCPVHGPADVSSVAPEHSESGGDGETDTSAVESGIVGDVSEPDWGCCDRPRPRIHEQTNRFFCGNCLLWLTGSNDEASGTTPNDADEGTVGQSPEAGGQE